MARFYGWTHQEIMDLSEENYTMYYKGMTILSAQENLMAINVSCAPSMSKQARRKFHDNLARTASPEPHILTHEDMARLLNG